MPRLYPRPAPKEIPLYYPGNYWFAVETDSLTLLEERYRRLVLRDHVRFVEKALRAAPQNPVILDVGCGGGLFPRMLRERGWKALGMDFSSAAADLACRFNHVPAVCGLLENSPFRSGSLGAVTMFHLLEHVPDPALYLKRARELLRPGGRLVVQVPNAACWQFLLLGENWAGIDVPRHLWNFRAKDLDGLLERCGFQVLRHKYFSLRDNPAGLATSLAPSLDPMARRIRGIPETAVQKLARSIAYLAIAVAALPFTALEAACQAGSTVMVEARPS